MELYHASGEIVKFPEVRKSLYTKDFSWGFYCTNNIEQDFISNEISREAFWELMKFKHPTHQISFHTLRALDCLEFMESREIHE